MQKNKLDTFIQKYNLGGTINSVKWMSDGSRLITKFMSEDKSLMGKVCLDNFKFDPVEIGIYQTDQLNSLLGVLGDDINLTLVKVDDKPVALKIKHKSTSIDYMLTDTDIIDDPPNMKQIPNFETKIKLNSDFISTFIKGKNALSDVNTCTLIDNTDTKSVDVVIGFSSINTNRINIATETLINGIDDNISFNANLFKEILIANKECKSAILEISNKGLLKIQFKTDDYTSNYMVVATQNIG